MGLALVPVDPEKAGIDELGFPIDMIPAIICDICGKLISNQEGNVVFNALESLETKELPRLLFVHKDNCDDFAKQNYQASGYIDLDSSFRPPGDSRFSAGRKGGARFMQHRNSHLFCE
jgi:hypothetical protein